MAGKRAKKASAVSKAEQRQLENDALDNLGRELRDRFSEAEKDRSDAEKEWLEDLRQYRGIYPPEVKARIRKGKSSRFLRQTTIKVNNLVERIMSYLFPSGDRQNWGAEPTPKPELRDEDIVPAVAAKLRETPGMDPAKAREAAIQEIASERARNMSRTIADQLAEMGEGKSYFAMSKAVVFSGVLHGLGVLKGPTVLRRRRTAWVQEEDGWNRRVTGPEEFAPFVSAPDIFSIYPDTSVDDLADGAFVFERHVKNKPEVQDLARRRDFKGAVIASYLRDHKDGDVGNLKSWESELRQVRGDATAGQEGKYELLEFWGYLSGRTLLDCGLPETKLPHDDEAAMLVARAPGEAEIEPAEAHRRISASGELAEAYREARADLEFPVNVWVLGGKVVKMQPARVTGRKWPYYFWYFSKDRCGPFGEGMGRLLRDPQSSLNAAMRAMLDNAGVSAGPQAVLNLDLLEMARQKDGHEIVPWKVWLRRGTDLDGQTPAIQFIDVPNYSTQFMAMIKFLSDIMDDLGGPRWMSGDGQVRGAGGKTSSGLSMLMGAMSINILGATLDYDDRITQPFIQAMYSFNMLLNPDPSIKGDFKIVAQGSRSLLQKEVLTQRMEAFANGTNNPRFGPWVEDREILVEWARSMDLPSALVRTPERHRQVQMEEATMQRQAQLAALVQAAEEKGIDLNMIFAQLAASVAGQQNAGGVAQ